MRSSNGFFVQRIGRYREVRSGYVLAATLRPDEDRRVASFKVIKQTPDLALAEARQDAALDELAHNGAEGDAVAPFRLHQLPERIEESGAFVIAQRFQLVQLCQSLEL